MNGSSWHFFIMIAASILVFLGILYGILGQQKFIQKKNSIFILTLLVVVAGMLFGKHGAAAGLPWWIYYPVPMLMTVLLPPVILKFTWRQTTIYLFFSFLSAPFIHVVFSFFLGWDEYMPFLKIPYWKTIIQ